MKPGPRTGTHSGDQSPYAQKAELAWGDVPDWVDELAAYADAHGAKAAGKAIGYSNSAVSVILNRGKGIKNFDIARIEEAVRGGLMGLTVECPIFGTIGRERCLSEQKEPFRASSGHRAQIYHACRGGCPHSRIKGESDERQ